MNSNSFIIKGWAVVLVSGLFALAAKDASPKYAIVAYLPLVMSWILDGFYLSRERQYRSLYDRVRGTSEKKINFSMDASSFSKGKNTWCSACLSKTSLLFYGILVGLTFIIMFLFLNIS